jgi:hypothetical protein
MATITKTYQQTFTGSAYYKTGTKDPICTDQTTYYGSTSAICTVTDTKVTAKSIRDASGWRPPLPYSRTITSTNASLIVTHPLVVAPYLWPALYCIQAKMLNRPVSKNKSWSAYAGSTTVPQWIQSEAVNGALNKLKSDVDLSEMFGEARESVAMIHHRIRTVASIWRACKRMDFRSLRKIFRGIRQPIRRWHSGKTADLWLEVQYGWLPLLSDIYQIFNALRDGIIAKPEGFKATVKRKVKDTTSWSSTTLRTSQNLQYYGIDYRYEGVTEYRCMVRLDYCLENPGLAAAASWGLTNPVNTAYQLTTLSFVLDWFLPIGKYLSALDASLGWKFLGGSKTTFVKQTVDRARFMGYWFRTASYPCGIPADPELTPIAHLLGCPSHLYMERSIYSASPGPMLPWIGKDPFNLRRLLTGLALIRQRA